MLDPGHEALILHMHFASQSFRSPVISNHNYDRLMAAILPIQSYQLHVTQSN